MSEKNKGGRPTRKKQLQMNEILRVYFAEGVGAAATSRETGYHENTVSKKFKIWADELVQNQKESFFDREIKSRESAIYTMDTRIVKLYKLLKFYEEKIEEAIKKKETPAPEYMESAENLNMKLAQLQLQKAAINMKAPSKTIVDAEVAQYVSEKLSKHRPE